MTLARARDELSAASDRAASLERPLRIAGWNKLPSYGLLQRVARLAGAARGREEAGSAYCLDPRTPPPRS